MIILGPDRRERIGMRPARKMVVFSLWGVGKVRFQRSDSLPMRCPGFGTRGRKRLHPVEESGVPSVGLLLANKAGTDRRCINDPNFMSEPFQ